jgi:hypothetical protein
MKKALILVGYMGLAVVAYAQVITTSGSQLSTLAGSEVSIKTTGNVTISQDVSNAKVNLELSGGPQTISESLILRKLTLSGSGDKTISKNLTVTENIEFILGILKPSATAKILYTGPFEGVTGGSDNSYVDGLFYNQSTGAQFFPIGVSGLYAPATLLSGNAQKEVGIMVVNQSLNTIPATDSDIKKIDSDHHWEVTAASVADIGSQIKLSLNGVDPALASDQGLTLAVVQAGNTTDPVDGLGSASYDNSSVTSQRAFTKSLLGVGASEEVVITVIDIITPKVDQHNDFLRVLNIEKFDIRKVKLLDRYGLSIKEWSDFTNYDDPNNPNQDGYDFNKLSSGNYICVVEYGNTDSEMKSVQQMISVIKN